jgi:phospholipid-binding lipoprotein MlaA
MNPQRLALLLFALLLSACAAKSIRPAEGAADPTVVEEEALASSSADKDPWEGFNRRMFTLNDILDRAILKPVAKGYTKVTPKFMRTGVSNFFRNLRQPVTAANLLLQGHPIQAASATGRFAFNAVFGIGGLFDPASAAEIPFRERDFGQTLARWGWDDSRYLVLPIFGPTTVRDGIGSGVSTTVSPVSWLARREGVGVSVLYGVDARASVLPMESFLQGAADPYLLIRDAYLQRRHCQVVDCSEEVPDYLLPDYDYELPDFDSLR